uniref:hypothetical protein n=1 Tax=Stappia sp. TaxID=1870903 RepID=UPI003BA986FE
MTLGDAQAWAGQFISLDERLVQRVAAVWSECISTLGAQPDEDTITINLVAYLGKDPVVRRLCHWVEYQFEPFGINNAGAKFSKGKIDIAILLDWERERYLAYECKRLNVVHRGRRSSLATEYVVNGMMRFMTEQYAELLPVGCMLGYVMDCDLNFAETQLGTAIAGHKPLGLASGPSLMPPMHMSRRFSTGHTRPTAQLIELRHTLLPFK